MNELAQFLHYATKVFALGRLLRGVRDRRPYAKIPTRSVLTSLLLGSGLLPVVSNVVPAGPVFEHVQVAVLTHPSVLIRPRLLLWVALLLTLLELLRQAFLKLLVRLLHLLQFGRKLLLDPAERFVEGVPPRFGVLFNLNLFIKLAGLAGRWGRLSTTKRSWRR